MTLDKEYIVLLDIERELLADTFTTFDLVYNKSSPLFGQLFVDTKLPWMFGDSPAADNGRKTKKRSLIGQLVDTYNQHKTGKKE